MGSMGNKLNIKKMLALLAEQDQTCFFFGYLGIACALVFANLGAAYGTAKSAVGISSLAVIDSSKIFQGLIPIIMAGILGIYGVIISVIANAKLNLLVTISETRRDTLSLEPDFLAVFQPSLLV